MVFFLLLIYNIINLDNNSFLYNKYDLSADVKTERISQTLRPSTFWFLFVLCAVRLISVSARTLRTALARCEKIKMTWHNNTKSSFKCANSICFHPHFKSPIMYSRIKIRYSINLLFNSTERTWSVQTKLYFRKSFL